MLIQPERLQVLHYIGSLGPLIAAVALTARDRGRVGLLELWRRSTRGPRSWVLAALALPALLYACGWIVSFVAGERVPLGDFFSSKEYVDVGLRLILIEIVFFGYGEEVGWRGYGLPALEVQGRSAYVATTWLAVLWAGWHAPLFFYPYGLSSLTALLTPGWFLSILFSSYLITFFFKSSNHSLLVVAILHGMVDLFSITPASNAIILVVMNAGLIAASVAVVVRYAPSLRR